MSNLIYKTVLVIVASGTSDRVINYTNYVPKQYIIFKNKMLIEHTIDAFIHNINVDGIILVVNEFHKQFYQSIPKKNKILSIIFGGKRRQDSVVKGLEAAERYKPENVLVHDGVRPFVSQYLISEILSSLEYSVAVVPAVPIYETVAIVNQNHVLNMVDRDSLYLMQTPQGFKFDILFDLYKKNLYDSEIFTDEVTLMKKYGHSVKVISGDHSNIKITHNKDIDMINYMNQGLLKKNII